MTTVLAGLILGVAGGAHCTAMCGPLIAAVSPRGWNQVRHHAGRALTYLVLGLVAGVTGGGATAAGYGRWVSWAAALFVVIQAIRPSTVSAHSRSRGVRLIVTWVAKARGLAGTHPRAGSFLLGILNGLLPCGLTYAATVAAIGTGSIGAGVQFMSGFAIGTTAILSLAGSVWLTLSARLPMRAQRFAPVAFAAVALLLVWRGWATTPFTHLH